MKLIDLECLFKSTQASLIAHPKRPIKDAYSKTIGKIRAVYVIWDNRGTCLYVGKSEKLRVRLQQHVTGSGLSYCIAQERQIPMVAARKVALASMVSIFQVSAFDILRFERFVQFMLEPKYGMSEDERAQKVDKWKMSRLRMALSILNTALIRL